MERQRANPQEFQREKAHNQGLKGPFFKGENHDKTPQKAHRNGQFGHLEIPNQAPIQAKQSENSPVFRRRVHFRHHDHRHLQTAFNIIEDSIIKE